MSESKRVQEAHDALCRAIEILAKVDHSDTYSAWRVIGHLDILLPTAHDRLCEELGHEGEVAFGEALRELFPGQQQLPFGE